MAYIDKARMIAAFGNTELQQLTDRDGTVGAIVDAVLDPAMADAIAEVDSYIGARYSLPLPSVPDIIPVFACDIARWRLYDHGAPEEVQKRYDRAVSWLRDVSKAVVSLGIKTTDTAPTESIAVSSSRAQVFTDDVFSTMGPSWTQ
jgi:phage gp36-like protein